MESRNLEYKLKGHLGVCCLDFFFFPKQFCEADLKTSSLTLMHNLVYFYLHKLLNHLEFFMLILQEDIFIWYQERKHSTMK